MSMSMRPYPYQSDSGQVEFQGPGGGGGLREREPTGLAFLGSSALTRLIELHSDFLPQFLFVEMVGILAVSVVVQDRMRTNQFY